MVELIERSGKQTTINGKPVDLGILVNNGTDMIYVSGEPYDEQYVIRQRAIRRAFELATEYGCKYVLMGQQARWIDTNWLFIVSFYNDKK